MSTAELVNQTRKFPQDHDSVQGKTIGPNGYPLPYPDTVTNWSALRIALLSGQEISLYNYFMEAGEEFTRWNIFAQKLLDGLELSCVYLKHLGVSVSLEDLCSLDQELHPKTLQGWYHITVHNNGTQSNLNGFLSSFVHKPEVPNWEKGVDLNFLFRKYQKWEVIKEIVPQDGLMITYDNIPVRWDVALPTLNQFAKEDRMGEISWLIKLTTRPLDSDLNSFQKKIAEDNFGYPQDEIYDDITLFNTDFGDVTLGNLELYREGLINLINQKVDSIKERCK